MARKEIESIKRLDIAGHVNYEHGSLDTQGGRGLYKNFSRWVRDNNLSLKEQIIDSERKIYFNTE